MEKSAGFISGLFASQSKQSLSLDKRKCSGKNLLLLASLRDQKQYLDDDAFRFTLRGIVSRYVSDIFLDRDTTS